MKSKHFLPWLFVITAFAGVLLPPVVREGMFMDGLWYASISKNMANGAGSLWAPHFSDTIFPVFYDHPPLVFGIQSLFFRVLGDSFITERLYTLLTAIITLALIVQVWKHAITDVSYNKLGWMPVLFWLTIPLVHWAFANNMLENTMGIFIIAAFIFLWKSVDAGKINYLFTALAAAFITGAFLCKGFTGLFPLAFYFFHWAAFRSCSFKAMAIRCVGLLLLTTGFFLVLFLYPPSAHSLTTYLQTQVMSSIEGLREPVGRLFIIKRVLMEMVVFIPVALILIAVMRRRGMLRDHPYKKHSLFFLLVGLSGWLPIMVSQKQSGFYALCALPFLALSAAAFTAPLINDGIARIDTNAKIFKGATFFIAAALVVIVIYSGVSMGEPRTHRDREKLHLAHLVGPLVKGQTIGSCASLWHDWTLHGYFIRYYNVSLADKNSHEYFLTDSCDAAGLVPVTEINVHLEFTRLYKRASR